MSNTLRIDVEGGCYLPDGGSEYERLWSMTTREGICANDLKHMVAVYDRQLGKDASMFSATIKLVSVDADGLTTELWGVTLTKQITVIERENDLVTALPFCRADLTEAIRHIVRNAGMEAEGK